MSTSAQLNKHSGWFITAIALMCFLLNVDYTAINLALVTISKNLQANIHQVQWLLSGYMLAWAAIIIPVGKLQDKFGAKRLFIIGLLLFLVGSLLTGIAPNISLCILGRLLQGMSGALYTPASYALIYQFIPEHQRGRAMGILSIGVGFGMAAGPTVGGIILSYLSWRWIFFINIPLSLLSVAIIAQVTPNEAINKLTSSLDSMSCGLLAFGITGLIYSINGIAQNGMTMLFASILILAIILLLSFLVRQTICPNPLIPFSLFKNHAFSTIIASIFLEQFAFSSSVVCIALYLQKVLNLSVLNASLIFLGLNLTFGSISPIAGRINDRFGIHKLATGGLLALALAFLCFSFLGTQSSHGVIIASLIFMGLSMGIAFNALNTGIVLVADPKQVNVSMSLFVLFALLGSIVAVLVTTVSYSFVSYHYIIHSLDTHLLSDQLSALKSMINHIGNTTPNLSTFSESLQQKIFSILPQALNQGLRIAAWITIILQCIAASLCWRYLKKY